MVIVYLYMLLCWSTVYLLLQHCNFFCSWFNIIIKSFIFAIGSHWEAKSVHGVIPESNAASLSRFPASSLYFGLSSLALRASLRFSRRFSTSLLCSWCLDSASLIWLIMLSSAFRRESIISLSLVLTEMMALVARLSSVTFSCICFSSLGISASDLTIRLKSYPLTSRLMWQSSDGGKMMRALNKDGNNCAGCGL